MQENYFDLSTMLNVRDAKMIIFSIFNSYFSK
jgi:hypothetical protein